MKEIVFRVELTAKDLYRFSMHHMYTGLSGIFGVIFSLGCWIFLGVRYSALDVSAKVVLFVLGLLFTVIQPAMLYMKARTQVKRNKNVNACLQYKMSEDGIMITQGDQSASVKWYEVRKKVISGESIYLYMSPIRAFIFPKSQCGDDYNTINKMITEKMRKYKDYEPEENQPEQTEEKKDSEN